MKNLRVHDKQIFLDKAFSSGKINFCLEKVRRESNMDDIMIEIFERIKNVHPPSVSIESVDPCKD